eukprot:TRINITY_DN10891_c0_g1_i1.p1 TRINITY_DN10891_c0_g1~~TRINITY_DN10891_c0_g1_i1.p1  ORF type:complete len:158 (+),score=14.49 TRINITY_DN10891_c0_g1_i1:36-476(+)
MGFYVVMAAMMLAVSGKTRGPACEASINVVQTQIGYTVGVSYTAGMDCNITSENCPQAVQQLSAAVASTVQTGNMTTAVCASSDRTCYDAVLWAQSQLALTIPLTISTEGNCSINAPVTCRAHILTVSAQLTHASALYGQASRDCY